MSTDTENAKVITEDVIVNKILKYFCDILKDTSGDLTKIDMDADLFKVYGLKSAKAVRLISDIEVEYDIDIDESEIKNICNLNQIVDLVKAKLSEN